jgi:hypothetical protein
MTATATTFDALITKSNINVLKALKGGVLLGQMSAAVPSSLTIDSTVTPGTPVLQTLTGFSSMGFFSDSGAVFDESIDSSDTKAWGELEPVRRDITSDVTTLKVTGLESNKTTIAAFYDIDPTSLTPDSTTAELQIPKSTSPIAKYYRIIVLSQDGAAGSEYWIGRIMPRASITDRGSMTFDNGDTGIMYDMTFTAYLDSAAGYSVKTIYAGPAWKANLTAAGFGS